jgi:hypothetical protein
MNESSSRVLQFFERPFFDCGRRCRGRSNKTRVDALTYVVHTLCVGRRAVFGKFEQAQNLPGERIHVVLFNGVLKHDVVSRMMMKFPLQTFE